MTDPASSSLRTALLLALVSLAVITAGCSMLASDDPDLPSSETVDEKLDSLDAIEATVVSDMDSEFGANRSAIQMTVRPDSGEFRAEILEPERQAGTLIVSNGSTMAMYNQSANEVRYVDISGLSELRNGSMDTMVSVFEHLNDGSADVETPSDVSTLPMVPATGGSASPAVSSIPLYGNATFEYEGTATVNDRPVYRVGIVPQANEPLVNNYTVWIDQEWYYPLKTAGQIEINEENTSISMRYRNVTFNPDLPTEVFEIDPPDNATVVEGTNTSIESYDSREALAGAANRSLPDPTVPDGYEFESGDRFTVDSGEQLSLRYTNGSGRVNVMVQAGSPSGNLSGSETVDVDGRQATVTSVDEMQILRLPCGNQTHVVSGSVSRETAIEVASSLSCDSGS